MKRATVIVVSLLLVLIVLAGVAIWLKPADVEGKHPVKSDLGSTQQNSQPTPTPEPPPPSAPATPEEGKIETEKVTKMIAAYHTRMGENPVGTNAEITKALLGGNPVHATFSFETPKLNAKGELLDPWGTPYFFHQISGDDMEIHSAGPDKIMGTQDDIVEYLR